MSESAFKISELLTKYLKGEMTASEQIELDDWLSVSEVNREFFESEIKQKGFHEGIAWLSKIDKDAVREKLVQRLFSQQTPQRIHRVHFLKTAWFRYAAAIIFITGIGTYLYINNQKEKPSVTQVNPLPVQNDVAPGGNRATLTLADGSKIVLDSAKSGELAREENATITKTADGKIVYDPNEKLGSRILFNTMATPRGGQYQLTLPDGSQVWLNAESSIAYPTAFTEKNRKVSITGEAYFEVAKKKNKPFIVEAGEQAIEVLGTHFNINTYSDEPFSNTTLLEGSVHLKTVHTSLTLKPGQQGQWNPRNEKLSLAVNPDVEQAVAWKNGMFLTGQEVEISTFLRQVARWYDVDIKYSGNVKGTIGGVLPRQVNVSKVLQLLESTGSIQYQIKEKTVIISPYRQ
jgi:transmembrane sensor